MLILNGKLKERFSLHMVNRSCKTRQWFYKSGIARSIPSVYPAEAAGI